MRPLRSSLPFARQHERNNELKRTCNTLITATLFAVFLTTTVAQAAEPLMISCRADNDLAIVLEQNGVAFTRVDTAAQAVHDAARGSGVLILADGYPQATTPIDATVFQSAAEKQLRLYVEFPAMLPDLELGQPAFLATGPYNAIVERTVVSSDAFGPALAQAAHPGIQGLSLPARRGAQPRTWSWHASRAMTRRYMACLRRPIPSSSSIRAGTYWCRRPSSASLSLDVTRRPKPGHTCGSMILQWLQPGTAAPLLTWTATVRPMYQRGDALPDDAQQIAARRGIEYYGKSRLYIHPAGRPIRAMIRCPPIGRKATGRTASASVISPSASFSDGSQAVSRTVRADCNLEAAMGLACGVALLNDPAYMEKVQALNDLIFFKSIICGGPRSDPKSPSYGLIGGSEQSPGLYWGDDNARALLSAMAAAALLRDPIAGMRRSCGVSWPTSAPRASSASAR